ncbi:MAG: DUF86 domain-containing protein [bacterium]
MVKDNKIFLKHALGSIEIINNTLKNVSEAEYSGNMTIQDAVVRRMEIIGEAVKNLDKDFVKKNKDADFNKIARMRDKLIHHYFGVDLKLVWDTVKNDLPKLKKDIERILHNT